MQALQGWFSGGVSEDRPTSLVAEWNSYATTSHSGAGLAVSSADLEAGEGDSFLQNPVLKQANTFLLKGFASIDKGVRELPGSIQTSAQNIPSRQAIMYFGLSMGTGIFFLSMAFTVFLPLMVVAPQKFAVCFTLGCLFVIGAFFVLKGPKNQLHHMLSAERLPFTCIFLASMAATIYVSMVMHSYLLSVVFSGIQVMSLLYYAVSYFPGGAAGMRFLGSMATSVLRSCFGR